MTLTSEQFSTLIENYANQIIDGLDASSLELMVFDLLVREYQTYTEEQILGEIEDLYGEEVATEFLADVTDGKVAQ
jgi:hypothetical protein